MHTLRKWLKFFVNSITKTNLYIAYAVAATLVLFGGIMLYEAIARHFFNNPTIWGFEYSKMCFGFYMIWAGVYTAICSEHITMDIFYSKWSSRTQAIMDCITFIFFLFFVLLLFYLVFTDALSAISFRETSNSTLAQPLYHWRMALAGGVFLLLLQGVAQFIQNLWFAVNNEEL